MGDLVDLCVDVNRVLSTLLPNGFALTLERLATEFTFRLSLYSRRAIRVGYRKIGHAPIYLEEDGCREGSDLKGIVDRLFNLMLGYFPSAPDEVIQAFVEIYQVRPEELVEILDRELDLLLDGIPRTFDFPANYMYLVRVLTSVDVGYLALIVARSTEFYGDRAESHYWDEHAFEFYRRLGIKEPELLPDDLSGVVKEFVRDETRASVQRAARKFWR